MSDFYSNTYNPDVLSCLANLSNDEVFTPPEVVNQMLDMLPQELFNNKETTFLDPACKSGVFLREIAKRLLIGLENEIPDLQKRIDHIFQNQLFGIAITEMTSLLSRRSLYCSKYPNSIYSVTRFNDPEGNVRFKRTEHAWKHDKCIDCGASKAEYDRSEELETHAYEFIHEDNHEEIFDMKFDVIIGNPPYQLNDGGGTGSSATPIYQHFIEQAIKLQPRFLSMIVPARWQSGGKGLDSFRTTMLNDSRLIRMVTIADSRDCFNGVDIAGGVCYFLWARDEHSKCNATYIDESGVSSNSERDLAEFPIFIPSDIAVSIIHKVNYKSTAFYNSRVKSRNPFGIGAGKESDSGDLTLRYRNGLTRINYSCIQNETGLIDKWKVITSKASAEHAGQSDKKGFRKILSIVEILPPQTVCSETYLIVDSFETEEEAKRLAQYLQTKFARYLIWQATPTQNISKSCFMFLPIIQEDVLPTDKELFELFELSENEIIEIEEKIKPFPDNCLESIDE